MTLEGRRAVVTGATRGIGAAIARGLDECGVATLIIGRDDARLSAMAASLTNAKTFAANLADTDAAARISEVAPKLLDGEVDILVNNAGIFVIAPVDAMTDEVIDEMLAVNLAAPFRLLRAFLPGMRARASGHVVTIGSVADRATYKGNAGYAATKYGSRALHQVTRAELQGTGVRSTLVSPGPTDTPLWDPYDPDKHTDQFTPRAAMLQAAHVADAVLWALTRPQSVNIDELRMSHG